MLSENQRLFYERNKDTIRQMILQEASEKGQIIHGGKAFNEQIAEHLKKETKDYDVFTKNAKKAAQELVKKLNRYYRGEHFRVEQAKHKGTFKVKSNLTGETIADYTGQGKKPKTVNILGVKYASLGAMKSKIKNILATEDKAFRHDKDRETLQRIQLNEGLFNW